LQAKVNATAHPFMGTLNQTIQQEWDRKVWGWFGETAVHSGSAWRMLSPLAVAILINSQAIIDMHQLTLFVGL
jgi:hypothetical protein